MSASLTVYRACDRTQPKVDIANDATVEVTARRPEDGTWDVLYELHPQADKLEETDTDGVFRVRWREAVEWPHQITAK